MLHQCISTISSTMYLYSYMFLHTYEKTIQFSCRSNPPHLTHTKHSWCPLIAAIQYREHQKIADPSSIYILTYPYHWVRQIAFRGPSNQGCSQVVFLNIYFAHIFGYSEIYGETIFMVYAFMIIVFGGLLSWVFT